MADNQKVVTAALAMADAFGATAAKAAIDFALNGGAPTNASVAVAAPVKVKGKPGRKPKAAVAAPVAPDADTNGAPASEENPICQWMENGVKVCTQPAKSKGFCSKHYQTNRRLSKNGAEPVTASEATA